MWNFEDIWRFNVVFIKGCKSVNIFLNQMGELEDYFIKLLGFYMIS